jgi:hypothetical protein
MKHQSIAELTHIADVQPTRTAMSRCDRLERWAECLEREPKRQLRSLEGIEYGPEAQRRAARENNSPLAVAFADPVLREEGLKSDRLGDALDFFDMSQNEAHRVLCSCMHGHTMRADEVARRVRGVMTPTFSTFPMVLGVAGLAVTLPLLVQLLR